ncbi:MAG: PAS domain-containing protein, partial [Oscillospiraceae bacterium]
MVNPIVQQYIQLVDFLGYALGPDYEIALHDLTNQNQSIVAIANNHISGRQVGAPMTNVGLK